VQRALATFGLVLAGLAVSPSLAGASGPRFCDERVAHDYAKPFERMAPESPPPEGELPFGPRNLSMYRLNFGTRIVRDGGHLGYRFAAKDAGKRSLHLNWNVDAKLWAIDAGGRPVRLTGERHGSFGYVRHRSLPQFAFPAHTGLYRFDITFRSLDGRLLRAYNEYFRVVSGRVGVRLAVGRSTFHPGETVYVQARNFGTEDVLVAARIPVERKVGSEWVTVPQPPSTSITQRSNWWLGIGEAAPCSKFRIPLDALPGAYRFAARAQVFGSRSHRTLTAAFGVNDASSQGL
jgi:hypothetical protein